MRTLCTVQIRTEPSVGNCLVSTRIPQRDGVLNNCGLHYLITNTLNYQLLIFHSEMHLDFWSREVKMDLFKFYGGGGGGGGGNRVSLHSPLNVSVRICKSTDK